MFFIANVGKMPVTLVNLTVFLFLCRLFINRKLQDEKAYLSARGIQRMQTSKSEIDIKFKGKDYRSFVSRTPDESLPHVTNEMGDTYMDNKIVLRLTRGGESVFNKTFTKNDFSSVVDADFLAKSVLEGIVYDKTTPQGIVYAASVCYPQTDLYVPLSITITADGKMSIQKVDMLEDAYEEETPD